MATQVLTADRPSDAIITALGGISETNDRIAVVSIRPGMREGELHGLAVQCWGSGHWCVCNGHVSCFTDREAAIMQMALVVMGVMEDQQRFRVMARLIELSKLNRPGAIEALAWANYEMASKSQKEDIDREAVSIARERGVL